MYDSIKFKLYTKTDKYQIIEEKAGAREFYIASIHNENSPLIGGFELAAYAISFAEKRIKNGSK